MDLSGFLTPGAWLALLGGIWTLFSRAEEVASPAARHAISQWLRDLDVTGVGRTWPATFTGVFDSLFGERHWSWRCFRRSCVASLVWVMILAGLWTALRPSDASEVWQAHGVIAAPIMLTFTAMLNFVPDYLSLLKTRYFVASMSHNPSAPRTHLLLLGDSVVTCVIGFLALLALYAFGLVAGFTDTFSLNEFNRETFGDPGFYVLIPYEGDTSVPPAGIWFYSTFFTSVWVWLYALSGAAIKLVELVGIGLARLRSVLDVDQKPLLSLGVVSMVLVSLAFWTVALWRWLS
jgi:hypothetical protein